MLAKCAEVRWSDFGRDIENVRVARGMTTRALSKELKMVRSTLERAEWAEPVSVPVFLILCQWMKIEPLTYLLNKRCPYYAGCTPEACVKCWEHDRLNQQLGETK